MFVERVRGTLLVRQIEGQFQPTEPKSTVVSRSAHLHQKKSILARIYSVLLKIEIWYCAWGRALLAGSPQTNRDSGSASSTSPTFS
jgi:hypothetical protein